MSIEVAASIKGEDLTGGIVRVVREIATRAQFTEAFVIIFDFMTVDGEVFERARALRSAAEEGVVWLSVDDLIKTISGCYLIEDETSFGFITREDAGDKVWNDLFEAAPFNFHSLTPWYITIPDRTWLGAIEARLEIVKIYEP